MEEWKAKSLISSHLVKRNPRFTLNKLPSFFFLTFGSSPIMTWRTVNIRAKLSKLRRLFEQLANFSNVFFLPTYQFWFTLLLSLLKYKGKTVFLSSFYNAWTWKLFTIAISITKTLEFKMISSIQIRIQTISSISFLFSTRFNATGFQLTSTGIPSYSTFSIFFCGLHRIDKYLCRYNVV